MPGLDRRYRSAGALPRIRQAHRTWHPRTRPDDVTGASGLVWTGLEVLDTVAGGADDEQGEMEFRARFQGPSGPGLLHERSRFERRAGRWVYVDGETR